MADFMEKLVTNPNERILALSRIACDAIENPFCSASDGKSKTTFFSDHSAHICANSFK